MSTVHSATAAAKAARRRAAGDGDVVAAGLPPDHPAVVFALAFLAGLLSAETHRSYGAQIGSWFRWCLERTIDPFAATRTDARAYLVSLGERLRPSSQGTYIGGVRSFYEEAEAEGLVARNPFQRVRPRGARRSCRRTPALTAAELTHALQRAAGRVRASRNLGVLRNYVLVYTGARLGLRRAEYSALSVGSRRRRAGESVLEVVGKGGTIIELPVPDDVDELLAFWLQRLARAAGRPLDPDDALFPKFGKGDSTFARLDRAAPLPALEPPGVASAVQRVLADGGLAGPRYGSHVLRATAATLAHRMGGANRFDVMRLLRHADPATTDRYIDGETEVSAADRWRPDDVPTTEDLRAAVSAHRRRRKGREGTDG